VSENQLRDQRSRPLAALAKVTPAAALFPLRVFLGATFAYAGIQKLSDPGFLTPGAPTYIGTQLDTFAHGTPGGFLLRTFALPHPSLAGVGVAFVEIAVGLLVLGGLLTRAAAAAGLALNLILFLTNSWRTYPYFLGSDIVFVFAWLPFVLAGSVGQPSIETLLDRRQSVGERTRRRQAAAVGARRLPPTQDPPLTRRAMLARAVGVTGAAAVALSAISTLVKGSYQPSAGRLHASATRPPATTTAASRPATGAASGSGQASAAGRALPSGAVQIGSSTQLPRNQGALYADPHDRQQDILVRHSDGTLSAFSAICTHAGCTVGYQSGQIVCPCHGGLYNATTGAVEGGPPPAPLPARRVLERHGALYAIPT